MLCAITYTGAPGATVTITQLRHGFEFGFPVDFRKLTDPDDSEHVGVQNPPFVANDGGTPKQAFRGSAMYVIWGGIDAAGGAAVTQPDTVTPTGPAAQLAPKPPKQPISPGTAHS